MYERTQYIQKTLCQEAYACAGHVHPSVPLRAMAPSDTHHLSPALHLWSNVSVVQLDDIRELAEGARSDDGSQAGGVIAVRHG